MHIPVEPCSLYGPRGAVADRVRVATTGLARLRGLIGRPPDQTSWALLLAPCRRVHTYGVRFPIDAVFCDDDLNVLDAYTLAPRRVSPRVAAASCCIELPAGRAAEAGLRAGAGLSWGEAA